MRRCELYRRQRHVLPHVLRVEYEALLQLHGLLLLMLLLHVLMLLLLSYMSLLHLLLLLLLLLSFLFLSRGSMGLRNLFG